MQLRSWKSWRAELDTALKMGGRSSGSPAVEDIAEKDLNVGSLWEITWAGDELNSLLWKVLLQLLYSGSKEGYLKHKRRPRRTCKLHQICRPRSEDDDSRK